MASADSFGSDDELQLQPLQQPTQGLPGQGLPGQGLPGGLPSFDFGPEPEVIDAIPVSEAVWASPDNSSSVGGNPTHAGPSSAGPSPIGSSMANLDRGISKAAQVSSVGSPSLPNKSAGGPAQVPVADQATEAEVAKRRHTRRLLLSAVPSWLISLVLHIIVIVSLALVTMDPVSKVMSILEGGGGVSEGTSIEDFAVDGTQEMDSAAAASGDEQMAEATSDVSPVMELTNLQGPSLASIQTNFQGISSDVLSEKLIDRGILSSGLSSSASAMLNSRSGINKGQMLARYGGSAESEKSVALALKWLADHQLQRGPKPGAWSFNHTLLTREQSTGQGEFAESTNAATAMALLPFLGAGQTHLEGQYKKTVKAGLASLISSMQVSNENGLPVGSWHEKRGNMYSHSLATIVVCEAYAMTRDPDLLQPAQLALNYIINYQDPKGGGWRYTPKQAGDTSVVGWCLMGLKSGRMGNLSVPNATFMKANEFLDFVSTDNGAYYGYDRPRPERNAAQTSIGLLCRMYMGWPQEHPGIKDGVAYLSSVGPRMDDLYYTYYSTQVMRHFGGETWTKWNARTRDLVIKEQVKEGTDAGSWEPKGSHSKPGGRLYQTALATMILEVYYRHLPLYSEKTVEDEFEI